MSNYHPVQVKACLNPECGAPPPLAARGLCDHCYSQARTAVKRGEVTWAALEKRGVARPTHFYALRCSANWLSQTPEAVRRRRAAKRAAEQSAKAAGSQPPT